MKRTLLAVVILVLLVVSTIIGYIIYTNYRYSREEKIIEQRFYEETAQLPSITIDRFMLWEGDSMATIDIEGKGSVSMWYGINGIPRIQGIGGLNTETECFYVDGNDNKTKYAHSTSMVITNESDFSRWFSFEVNSLSDLIIHYDDIVSVLGTFPRNVQLVSLTDSFGTREVRAESDSDFIIRKEYLGKPIVCDVFIKN